MTIATQLKSRLLSLKKFATFFIPNFRRRILELMINNNSSLAFPKCGLPFMCIKYYPKYKESCSDFDNFGFI